MDLKEKDILGEDIARHWYYQSKAKAMVRMIAKLTPRRILDIGSGSGFFSRYLLSGTTAVEALCVDISYPRRLG
jgi:methylase of polypeptide subunit release factors